MEKFYKFFLFFFNLLTNHQSITKISIQNIFKYFCVVKRFLLTLAILKNYSWHTSACATLMGINQREADLLPLKICGASTVCTLHFQTMPSLFSWLNCFVNVIHMHSCCKSASSAYVLVFVGSDWLLETTPWLNSRNLAVCPVRSGIDYPWTC